MGNIFKSIFNPRRLGHKEHRVLFQGLDAAGKTTILYRLKLGEVVAAIPTIGFNVEELKYNNITFSCWDVGGGDKIRLLMRHYYPNTTGLVVVVDSNDRDRIELVKEDIIEMLLRDKEDLQGVPILILANK